MKKDKLVSVLIKAGKLLLFVLLLALTVVCVVNSPASKVIITGDIDGNGEVTQSDITYILDCATSLKQQTDSVYLRRADTNNDGILTAADAQLALVNLVSSVTDAVGVEPEGEPPLVDSLMSATKQDGTVITVSDTQNYNVISNEKMYIYPDLSQVMEVKDSFVIVTFGWGHGVGMSQWGAIGLARAGYSYIQIVQHYYKNSAIIKEQYPATVKCGGKDVDTVEMLARIVQKEIAGCTKSGNSLDMNALRAQAVAAYTNLKYCGYKVSGCSYVNSYEQCRNDVKQVAQEIAGQYIQYKGNVIYAYYSACSAGISATYEQVWGNTSKDMSYLTNSASYYDCYTSVYVTATAYSPAAIKEYIQKYDSSIVLSDNPAEWIKILKHDDAVNENIGYVSAMQIGNKTISQGAGLKFRDNIMRYDIKSPCFAIIYNGQYL